MNVTEAKQILNNFGSTHEHASNKYFADFSIKIYNVRLPNGLTEAEREYIENHPDPYFEVREALVANIRGGGTTLDAMITGRSNGWITVEWLRPETDDEIIAIAKDIEIINQLVTEAKKHVSTEEFWFSVAEELDNEPNVTDKQLLGVQFDGGHQTIRFFRWYANEQKIMYTAYSCPTEVFFDMEKHLSEIGLMRYAYGNIMYSSFIRHDAPKALSDLFTWVQWGK